MLVFDIRGVLVPYKNIPSTTKELQNYFASDNHHYMRHKLFEQYKVYSNAFKEILGHHPIKQWIDGSFVTKKMVPNDLDMVSFVHNDLVRSKNVNLEEFKFPRSFQKYGVDAYLVEVYDPNDARFVLCQADTKYWMNTFDRSRRNKLGKKVPKGFIEIIY